MVRYLLSWSDPNDRLFDITLRFVAPQDDPRLLLPAWRPGRYLIQNYAANVREWSAGERRIWKEGKTVWRVAAKAGEEVEVTWRYYAGVLDAGSSFLDPEEAYFNGTNLFMLVEGLRREEHLLTIAAPADWRIETQLPHAEGADPNTFLARDYDHLIDSPTIAAAALTRHTFSESGARIHLVFHGAEGVDTDIWVEPARAIVRAQARMFGGLPFAEYRFLYHLRDKWHGVEHEDSCSIIARRAELIGARPGDAGFDHLLSITSHEFFHVWNVKRILPARFAPYDYWQESPTRLLWAMEGTTSYFGDLALVRAGIWSPGEYLDHLAGIIETLEGLPGRRHLALSQASFDGWLADPAQMHDHASAWFSFYTKGEIVSALLDLAIRRASAGAKALEDVWCILWQEYGQTGRGLEEDAVGNAVRRVADVGDFFEKFVDGTSELPYAELFAEAGVEFVAEPREPGSVSLGARLRNSGGSLLVDAALQGGAAREAGLLPGDEIIALDGNRVASEAEVTAALRGLRTGDTCELTIARAGRLRSLSLTGRSDPRPRIRLRVEEETPMLQSWLRRDG
jgi:predicted metalloprotease with PDZ domain